MTLLIAFLAIIGALSLAAFCLILVACFIGSRVRVIESLGDDLTDAEVDAEFAYLTGLLEQPYNHETEGL